MSASLVVVTGLEDDQIISVDEVDESMLFIDSPRPTALEHVTKLLGFTNAASRLAQRSLDQSVDASEARAVRLLPI